MLPWNEVIRAFLVKTALRDQVMLVNMVLFCLLGVVMVIRAWMAPVSSWAPVMGFGLLLAGIYRGCLVYKILKRIRNIAP